MLIEQIKHFIDLQYHMSSSTLIHGAPSLCEYLLFCR